MTDSAAFREIFSRFPALVRAATADLTVDELSARLDADANSIAWLIWHLTRVEDDHISGAATALGRAEFADQVYVPGRFEARFALPFDPKAHGYGHTSDDVAKVRAPGDLLVDYYDAVHAKTDAFLAATEPADWDAVVDTRWTPPVTLLVRMASIINDVAEHVGQADFIRGILVRRRG